MNVVEICAGAGGQALGLERAGFHCVLAVDHNADCTDTLRINRPQWAVRCGDIADRNTWNPPEYFGVDLLAGGVPCQPFTVAGLQAGQDDKRDMLAWAVSVVGQIMPKAVMLENVRGLSHKRFEAYRAMVLQTMQAWGYECSWQLIDAKNYGVPQTRTRFVLVGMLPRFARNFSWPQPTGLGLTVGETCKDLMAAEGWDQAEQWAAGANQIAPTIVGGSKQHGGPDLGPTRAREQWALLGVDGRGVANTAPEAGWRPAVDRAGPKLTVDMVKRIQGFPDEWLITGRKTSRYQQVGNAFPPPVAEAIGTAIAGALS